MAELWFPVPPLAGDGMLLRPWREADVPGMVLAFSDPVMQRFSWRTTPYTETDARDYFAEQEQARLRGDALHLALVEPHDQDVVLGCVSLHEVRLDHGCAAAGYWLVPQARGRGAATHAARLLVDLSVQTVQAFGFRRGGLHVEGQVHQSRPARDRGERPYGRHTDPPDGRGGVGRRPDRSPASQLS
jgi:RimJ/RimL family protein N-acetyltransferase